MLRAGDHLLEEEVVKGIGGSSILFDQILTRIISDQRTFPTFADPLERLTFLAMRVAGTFGLGCCSRRPTLRQQSELRFRT